MYFIGYFPNNSITNAAAKKASCTIQATVKPHRKPQNVVGLEIHFRFHLAVEAEVQQKLPSQRYRPGPAL